MCRPGGALPHHPGRSPHLRTRSKSGSSLWPNCRFCHPSSLDGSRRSFGFMYSDDHFMEIMMRSHFCLCSPCPAPPVRFSSTAPEELIAIAQVIRVVCIINHLCKGCVLESRAPMTRHHISAPGSEPQKPFRSVCRNSVLRWRIS